MAPSRGPTAIILAMPFRITPPRPRISHFSPPQRESIPSTASRQYTTRRTPRAQPYRTRPTPSVQPTTPSAARISRFRRLPLILTSLAGGAIALYTTSVYLAYKRDLASVDASSIPLDVSAIYDRTAEVFDADVDAMERVMRIRAKRKMLAAKAHGHVLEVSAGTGRNIEFLPLLERLYDGVPMSTEALAARRARSAGVEEARKGMKVQSVTLTDKSAPMITAARLKWTKTNPWFSHAVFRVVDAADEIPAYSPTLTHNKDEGSFDTVIQTMGLCSTPYPVLTLLNMALHTAPTGQILLLEHGTSHYSWLNRFLNAYAPVHASRHGCWFNKDVDALVAASGLEVLERKRWHFGTTYYYRLRAPSVEERTGLRARYVRERERAGLSGIESVVVEDGEKQGGWGAWVAGWLS